MTRAARYLPVFVLCLLVSACAAGSSGGSGGGGDTITAEELATVANLSLYDSVQRLRPRWLQPRAGQPLPRVMMNGSQMGGVEVLRGMQATDVQSVRFLDSQDATTRYGTGYTGGAIELVSRAP
jgi:hypothetical protein